MFQLQTLENQFPLHEKKKGYNDDENIKEDEIISAKKVIQKTEPIEYRMEYTEDEMKQIQLQQQMFENTPLPGDKNVDKLMKSMQQTIMRVV